VPITDESIDCDLNLIKHGFQWKIHNEYYPLVRELLKNVTNDINKIEGQCDESIIEEYDPIERIEGNAVLLKVNDDEDEQTTVGGKSRRNKKSKKLKKSKSRKMKKRNTKKERRTKIKTKCPKNKKYVYK
jgi:hypothetical protein